MKRLIGCLILVLAFVITVSGSYAAEKAHCPDVDFGCNTSAKSTKDDVGSVKVGECFKALPLPGCKVCRDSSYGEAAQDCNEKYPQQCKDGCWACDYTHCEPHSGVTYCYDKDGNIKMMNTL
ncbi:MAG: hypothetical protein A4E64_01756 [Syntrophorhabdus sp. PtaU1.Bin058]|nr:MAG: hypothetical protein A4E64_01756 [Syntrophorhabdus sp. PtaU1.Bin058]